MPVELEIDVPENRQVTAPVGRVNGCVHPADERRRQF